METDEGIKVEVFDNYNEIKGGNSNGGDAYAIYLPVGGYITEMNSAIAEGFECTSMFDSVLVNGLWDKTQTIEEIEEEIGGKLCEEARRALIATNIRGAKVALYFHKEKCEKEYLELKRFKKNIDNLPQKEWEKVQKILNKYGM